VACGRGQADGLLRRFGRNCHTVRSWSGGSPAEPVSVECGFDWVPPAKRPWPGCRWPRSAPCNRRRRPALRRSPPGPRSDQQHLPTCAL